MDNNNVNDTNNVNVSTEQPTMTQPNVMAGPTGMPQGNVVSPEEIANTLSPPTPAEPVVQEQIPVEAQNATPVDTTEVQSQVQPEAQVQVTADPQVVVDSTVTGAQPQPVQQEEPKKVGFFQKLFGKKEKN